MSASPGRAGVDPRCWPQPALSRDEAGARARETSALARPQDYEQELAVHVSSTECFRIRKSEGGVMSATAPPTHRATGSRRVASSQSPLLSYGRGALVAQDRRERARATQARLLFLGHTLSEGQTPPRHLAETAAAELARAAPRRRARRVRAGATRPTRPRALAPGRATGARPRAAPARTRERRACSTRRAGAWQGQRALAAVAPAIRRGRARGYKSSSAAAPRARALYAGADARDGARWRARAARRERVPAVRDARDTRRRTGKPAARAASRRRARGRRVDACCRGLTRSERGQRTARAMTGLARGDRPGVGTESLGIRRSGGRTRPMSLPSASCRTLLARLAAAHVDAPRCAPSRPPTPPPRPAATRRAGRAAATTVRVGVVAEYVGNTSPGLLQSALLRLFALRRDDGSKRFEASGTRARAPSPPSSCCRPPTRPPRATRSPRSSATWCSTAESRSVDIATRSPCNAPLSLARAARRRPNSAPVQARAVSRRARARSLSLSRRSQQRARRWCLATATRYRLRDARPKLRERAARAPLGARGGRRCGPAPADDGAGVDARVDADSTPDSTAARSTRSSSCSSKA